MSSRAATSPFERRWGFFVDFIPSLFYYWSMNIGDRVEKTGGDYKFYGVIVAKFTKKSGAIRLVVENDDGILHIYSEKNLKVVSDQQKNS